MTAKRPQTLHEALPGLWRILRRLWPYFRGSSLSILACLGILLLATALRNIKRVCQTLSNNPEGGELNLIARATLASLLSFAFGALFAHLAYEYYLFYLVGIGVGIQQVARIMQAMSLAPAGDFASTQRLVAADYDL